MQLGVKNSIEVLGFNAQLPECFASVYALVRHLDQGSETKQLSIYLRRETLEPHSLSDTALRKSSTAARNHSLKNLASDRPTLGVFGPLLTR